MFWNTKKKLEIRETIEETIKIIDKLETPAKKISIVKESIERLKIDYYLLKIIAEPERSFYFLDKNLCEGIFERLKDALTNKVEYINYDHIGLGAAEKIPQLDLLYRGSNSFLIKQTECLVSSVCIFRETIKSVSLEHDYYLVNGIKTIEVNVSEEYFNKKLEKFNITTKVAYQQAVRHGCELYPDEKIELLLKDTQMSYEDLRTITKAILNENNKYKIIWGNE
jgi:hypothetical protein